jgi:HSP20 family protein
VDRLFEDFGDGWPKPLSRRPFNIVPSFGRQFDWKVPAVDIVENDGVFEITAEVPGLDAKGLEVTLRNGNLVIKGQKQEETNEESKDYHLHERHFGSFERAFALPDGVDADKIEASFDKGILKVTLPKTASAQKPEKKITVKAA